MQSCYLDQAFYFFSFLDATGCFLTHLFIPIKVKKEGGIPPKWLLMVPPALVLPSECDLSQFVVSPLLTTAIAKTFAD